jgi:AraC family transcriptional regulator of adaptative response/methylated-DNA-[protein]-cysteine methyltransferase
MTDRRRRGAGAELGEVGRADRTDAGDEARWQAVLDRDPAFDGRFLFGVLTTGVYCRPSCAARRPLRRNVRFYESAEEAEKDGLRACLRCRPLAPSRDEQAARMAELCDYLRKHCDSGDDLGLAALAERASLSPSHLQRTFKAVVGVTPRQYVEACRLEALKRGLRTAESVTQAIYDAGFGSSSRVYERVDSRLGMTPREYRAGGLDVAISHAVVETPVGLMMVGATDRGLCFVQFGESRGALLAALRAEYPSARLEAVAEPYDGPLEQWLEALRSHLAGRQPHLDLPLAVRASAFQQEVWAYLQKIPYGEVRSYSEVARALGQPRATRAVARACASNRVALVIPCHRVIRANGDLGGYRWGLERKRRLLDREKPARVAGVG